MRLIDADSLEYEMCSGCAYVHNKYSNCIDCAIANAPTIDAQPVRHGHWIDRSSEQEKKGLFGIMSSVIKYRIVQCDQCGNMLDLDGVNAGRGDANFCPNCGAKMDNDS